MTLLLSEKDVLAVLDMDAALEAVEVSLRRQGLAQARAQPRRRLEMPGRVLLNYMAGGNQDGKEGGGWMGTKTYSVARGKASYVVLLYSAVTGELAAIIEADHLGRLRTGAATGIATKYMARADASVAAIVGTGGQARTQIEAVSRVRQLKTVRAFGRDASRRADFCREMSDQLGVAFVPAASAEEAVRGADIVVTMTNSATPVVFGEWISPGMHINAAGSNWAQKRELDAAAVMRAELLAVDSIEQSKIESGDLIQAFAADPSRWEQIVEVGQIVAGKQPGRSRQEERM
jgi:ornithine cyclodeaminase/alanine dehydrogenase-like protein (mu-crystallin family)